MDGLLAVATMVSTVAALGALFFAWLTVRESRAARRDDARAREIERLHSLLELAGAVAETAKSDEWNQSLGIAQLRLSTALAGYSGLPSCTELTEVEAEHAFEVFIDAREELHNKLERMYAKSA